MSAGPTVKPNFFISRTGIDAYWAQWIAQELEKARYTTYLQDWDFLPSQSFVDNMRKGSECDCTIAVLSTEYLNANFTQPEWQAAFARDPRGNQRRLLFVRVRDCQIPPLLAHYGYVDLVGKNEEDARQALLTAVSGQRLKRTVSFPGAEASGPPAPFPGAVLPGGPRVARSAPVSGLVLDEIVNSFERAVLQLDRSQREAIVLLLARIDDLRSRQRLFGQSTERQAEIWQLIYELNGLFMEHLGFSVLEGEHG